MRVCPRNRVRRSAQLFSVLPLCVLAGGGGVLLGFLLVVALAAAAWIFVLYARLIAKCRRVRELEEQVGLQERSSVVGLLASGVAHEINNPLTAAIGFSELLAKDPEFPEQYREQLRHIERATHRVRDITSSILDLARPGDLDSRPVDVHVLEESLEWARGEAERKGLSLETFLEPDLPPVLCHPHHLRQLVTMLLVYSMDGIEESGKGSTIRLRIVLGRQAVTVTVEDDGPGPDPGVRRTARGTGLRFAAEIARRHGGRLQVLSGDGGGTRVVLTLQWAKPRHGVGAGAEIPS